MLCYSVGLRDAAYSYPHRIVAARAFVMHALRPLVTAMKEAAFVAQDPVSSVRAQLTFEQQALFDALYAQRQKKLSTATVLSLPLLGTFGIEQFYLGNLFNGLLRLIFSFTLIPTL